MLTETLTPCICALMPPTHTLSPGEPPQSSHDRYTHGHRALPAGERQLPGGHDTTGAHVLQCCGCHLGVSRPHSQKGPTCSASDTASSIHPQPFSPALKITLCSSKLNIPRCQSTTEHCCSAHPNQCTELSNLSAIGQVFYVIFSTCPLRCPHPQPPFHAGILLVNSAMLLVNTATSHTHYFLVNINMFFC